MSLETQSHNSSAIGTPTQCVRQQPLCQISKEEDDGSMTFQLPLNLDGNKIEYYTICGHQLCAESTFIEMAIAGLDQINSDNVARPGMELSALELGEPLILSGDHSISLVVSLKEVEENWYTFAVWSSTISNGESAAILHCKGEIRNAPLPTDMEKIVEETEEEIARRRAVLVVSEHEVFTASTIYQKILGQNIEYRSNYRPIRKICLSEHSAELFAHCELPSGHEQQNTGILVDTMLQAATFAANMIAGHENLYLCHGIHSISRLMNNFASNPAFDIYCQNVTNSKNPECIVIDTYAIYESQIITIVRGICLSPSNRFRIQDRVDSAVFARSKYHPQPWIHLNSPGDGVATGHMDIRSPSCMNDGKTRSESSADLYPSPSFLVDDTIMTTETAGFPEQTSSELTLCGEAIDSKLVNTLDEKLGAIARHQLAFEQMLSCKTMDHLAHLLNTGSLPHDIDAKYKCSSSQCYLEQETTDSQSSTTDPKRVLIELLKARVPLHEQPEQIQQRQTGAAKAALFMIHPGTGICHEYYRLGLLDRLVLGIHDPRVFHDAQDNWKSIDEMAKAYCEIVRTQQETSFSRRLILAGHGFGGIVALETARKLAERGDCMVHGVVLIDAPPPIGYVPITKGVLEAAARDKSMRLSRTPLSHASELGLAIEALSIQNCLRKEELLRQYASDAGRMPRMIFLRSSEAVPADEPDTTVSQWEKLIGNEIDVINIPGNHFTPFEPGNVERTTAALSRACCILEQYGRQTS